MLIATACSAVLQVASVLGGKPASTVRTSRHELFNTQRDSDKFCMYSCPQGCVLIGQITGEASIWSCASLW